ncbi:MAG: ABC transporter permease [Firmicutes bacterium]|nr:ABC transporter permease [Bacillota bacterium]
MFSNTLFKKTLKDNYKFWLFVTLGLSVMLLILMMAANSFAGRMSERPGGSEGAGAFGANMILEQFYTMFAMLLPLIYIVITANKLIAAQVDRGSLSFVMAKPLKRNQVSMTQGLFLSGSIVAMFSVVTLVGLAFIGATGLDIEIGAFLLLNLGIVLFHLAISGISYLASCVFNLSSKSLLIGAGIPVFFFIANLLSNFSSLAEIMGYFKYASLNTLYNTADILAYSGNMIWQFLILFAVAAGCYAAGVMYFKRKDLPL